MSLVDVTSDQFRSRLRPFGISFEKSLADLIKGIRANNGDKQRLSQFFNDSIQECRNELKSNDIELKSMAILKLTYLEMYGFDLPFMNFQILEVMSSLKFQQKRIGYLAAIQILARENNDDVLMLMTNLLKKDLTSSNHVEVGLAISCLSSIVTKELARDVMDDLMKMFSHSKPYIRKKAVLASYKVFAKYPESLKMNYERLIDKLDDSEDVSVISATVNVICELAKKNPNNYIDLTPRFFELLTTSTNNWMIIRLLKLFSSLSLVEPRIKKKLLPAVVGLMSNTKASSLMYECINCILAGNMLSKEDKKVSQLMVEKLLGFVVTNDQNLKYVSILAFIKIIHIQSDLVKAHEDLILQWLSDEDLTIRAKSLELADGLIDRTNIAGVISKLLVQLADDESAPLSYKLQISQKILSICSSKKFSLIPNFDWYLATLKDLLHLMNSDRTTMFEISSQFPELGLRVPSLRPSIIEVCSEVVMDASLTPDDWWNNCFWCFSEYLEEYIAEDQGNDDDDDDVERIVDFMISESCYKTLTSLRDSATVLPIYISSLLKVYVKFINKGSGDFDVWTGEYYGKCIDQLCTILQRLEELQYSFSFGIQERAVTVSELFKILKEALENHFQRLVDSSEEYIAPPLFLTQGLPQLYNAYELKPIAQGVQQRLAVPECLDMDQAVDEMAFSNLLKLAEFDDVSEDDDGDFSDEGNPSEDTANGGAGADDLLDLRDDDDEAAVAKRRAERLEEQKDDPFYISGTQVQEPSPGAEPADGDGGKKSKKKKKPRRAHVTIVDEEDVVTAGGRTASSTFVPSVAAHGGKLKFKMDDSALAGIDLKSDTTPTPDDFAGDYEVEKLRKELAESHVTAPHAAEKEKKTKKKKKKDAASATASAETDKPKKKTKKRRAVIE